MASLSHQSTHATLPDVFEKLGVRELPIEGSPSKHDRMKAVLARVPDEDLPRLAERYITLFDVNPIERNEIQELLWRDAPGPKVPERYRREVAQRLSTEDLRARGLMDLLERLWVLDSGAFESIMEPTKSVRYQIERHVLQDPDFEPEDVFEMLGAYTCTDARFVAFVEGLCSHRFRPDAAEQTRMAKSMNEALCACGIELVHADDDGGYLS